MNIDKLKRQLINELKSNPKKSGSLGVLLLVGCYFWIPLFFSGDDDDRPDRGAPEDAAFDLPAFTGAVAFAGNSTKEEHNAKPSFSWDQLADAMDRDARRRSTTLSPLTHNPFEFERLTETEMITDEQLEAQDEPLKEVTPESAGLVLSSTIVGARRSMASINGTIYGVGDQIETEDGVKFKLRSVESRRIILQRGERRYALEIAEEGRSAQIKVDTD